MSNLKCRYPYVLSLVPNYKFCIYWSILNLPVTITMTLLICAKRIGGRLLFSLPGSVTHQINNIMMRFTNSPTSANVHTTCVIMNHPENREITILQNCATC